MLEFIIKLHPEISIKSKSVRKRQTLLLERNLKTILKQLDEQVEVLNNFDHLTVRSSRAEPAMRSQMIERLSCIPGIVSFSQMQTRSFSDLHDMFEHTCFPDNIIKQMLQGNIGYIADEFFENAACFF